MARTADEVLRERLTMNHTALAERCIEAESRLADVERELARCGRGHCMGKVIDGVRTWVTLQALQKVERERDEALAIARETARVAAEERYALLHQAEQHAMEARTQRATVHEIYRMVTGGTGEPGDWHGAEPVRAAFDALLADADEHRKTMEAAAVTRSTLLAELATLRERLEKYEAALEKIANETAATWVADAARDVLRAARGES